MDLTSDLRKEAGPSQPIRFPIWREPDGVWWFEIDGKAYGPFDEYENCADAYWDAFADALGETA
jgi:hypothetical protein